MFIKSSLYTGSRAISFLLIAALIFFQPLARAADRDTILNAVYSKPFIYNVLKDSKGVVYAGTSEGIFQLNGSSLEFVNNQDGYIALNEKGVPVVNPEGIKNHNETRYLHLLPFPDLSRQEYHAGTDDYFYISSGGKIYIYDIVPYRYSYANHSIRTISENYVGTYSGIYYQGQKLNASMPRFTDGYIREFEGRVFICYDWLLILEPDLAQAGRTDSFIYQRYELKHEEKKVQFRDIYKSKQDQLYYISSLTNISLLKDPKDSAVTIYTSK